MAKKVLKLKYDVNAVMKKNEEFLKVTNYNECGLDKGQGEKELCKFVEEMRKGYREIEDSFQSVKNIFGESRMGTIQYRSEEILQTMKILGDNVTKLSKFASEEENIIRSLVDASGKITEHIKVITPLLEEFLAEARQADQAEQAVNNENSQRDVAVNLNVPEETKRTETGSSREKLETVKKSVPEMNTENMQSAGEDPLPTIQSRQPSNPLSSQSQANLRSPSGSPEPKNIRKNASSTRPAPPIRSSRQTREKVRASQQPIEEIEVAPPTPVTSPSKSNGSVESDETEQQEDGGSEKPKKGQSKTTKPNRRRRPGRPPGTSSVADSQNESANQTPSSVAAAPVSNGEEEDVEPVESAPSRKKTLSDEIEEAARAGRKHAKALLNNENSEEGVSSIVGGRKRTLLNPNLSEPPKKRIPLTDEEKMRRAEEKMRKAEERNGPFNYYVMLTFISIMNILVPVKEQDDFHKEVISKVTQFSGKEMDEYKREEIELDKAEKMPDEGNYRKLNKFFGNMYSLFSSKRQTSQETKLENYKNEELKGRRQIMEETLKKYGSKLQLRLSSRMLLDVMNSTGTDILNAARNGIMYGRNDVYDCPRACKFPESSADLVKEEYEQLKKKSSTQNCSNQTDEDWLYIPTRVILAKNYNEKAIRKLSKYIPMSCIREIPRVNLQKFLVDAVAEANKNQVITVYRQIPQQCNSNTTVTTGKSTWKMPNSPSYKMPLSEFKKYCDEPMEFVKNLLKNKKFEKEDYEEFKKVVKIPSEKTVEFKNFFGTNIEMPARDEDGPEVYKEMWAEIDKLPEFLQPNKSWDLLESSKENMSGLNKPQLYFKTPGVRTGCHIENSGLASVNLNVGPGISAWFAVPFEFAQKMEELVTAKSAESLYGAYWPLEDDCRAAGIPVQVFHQKEGDLVYIAPGTFHWVQSLGFCTHISWNIGECTKEQLEIIAVMHDHQSLTRKSEGPEVPLQHIIWNMVKEGKKVEEGAELTLLNLFARCLAFAKMEMEFLKGMGETSTQMTEEQLKQFSSGWMKCGFEGCRKKLYNLVAMRSGKDGQTISYCMEHSFSSDEDDKPTFLHRNNLEEGAALFDKLKQKVPRQQ